METMVRADSGNAGYPSVRPKGDSSLRMTRMGADILFLSECRDLAISCALFIDWHAGKISVDNFA